jgi:hypothetical protein
MSGVRYVPYRLNELVAAKAKANGHPPVVHIVEGEKDADSLKQWGLLATTSPAGAGKWRSDYNQYFAGFDVVIIADNDEPGRKHAQSVGENLYPVAASVRILELRDVPEKGDISDWLDAGRSWDAFEALIASAEPFVPKPSEAGDRSQHDNIPKLIEVHDAGDIDVTKIPPRGWLLGTAFCRKFLSGLIGEGAAGKTAMRYAQYIAAATEKKLTAEYVHVRCRVLIVCLEDDLNEVKRRIGAAMLFHGITREEIKGWLFYCTPKGLKLLENGAGGALALGKLESELRVTIARSQSTL